MTRRMSVSTRSKRFINMKSSILCLFLVSTIACSLMVQAHYLPKQQNEECTCGNLGPGSDPCTCNEMVVQAAKLPEPVYLDEIEINDALQRIVQGQVTESQNGETVPSPDSSSNSVDYNLHLLEKLYSALHQSESSVQEHASGCGCEKYLGKSLDLQGLVDEDSKIVPRFPPIGDVCHPLPVDPRTGKIIERTIKVVPAYPGKIPCTACNPPVPYKLCLNLLTGKTTTFDTQNLNVHDASALEQLYSNDASNAVNVYGESSSLDASRAIGSQPSGTFGRLFSGAAGRLYSEANSNSGLYGLSSSSFKSQSRRLEDINSESDVWNSREISAEVTSGLEAESKQRGGSSDCFGVDQDEVQQSQPDLAADTVSLTLAYKNLHAPNVIYRQGRKFVPEDKLSFGHRTVPSDVKTEKKLLDVAEEKLVTLDRPVVELKPLAQKTIVLGSYDEREEAQLAELDAIEDLQSERQIGSNSFITYKDLGYVPIDAKYQRTQSSNKGIISGEIEHHGESPCGPLGPPVQGYVPGAVVVHEEVLESEIPLDSEESNENYDRPCPQ